MKRLISLIIAAIICFQLYPCAIAEAETGVLQFSDDFSGGLAGWDIEKKQFRTIGLEAALYNDNETLCTAKVAGETTLWGAVTVTFGINILKSNGGNFQLRLRNGGGEYFTLLLRPDNVKSFRYLYKGSSSSKNETSFSGNCSLLTGIKYQIKVIHSDEVTSVYVKSENDDAYTLAGKIDAAFSSTGSVSISTTKLKCKITDFKIYNDNTGSFYFENKMIKAKQGEKITVRPVNHTGKTANITYTSSDSEIISVDENGELSFLSGGNAVITASTYVDGIKYEDCFDAICTGVLSTFGFNGTTEKMYVGDVLNLCAVIRPDNVENKRIIWTSSDTSVAEIGGEMDDEKSIIAKAPGTAYISIQSVDNPYKKRTLTLIVDQPPEEILDVTFERDTYKREIPEKYFGMHSNPLKNISANKSDMISRETELAGLYKDLKLDFTRFMLNSFDWETGKYPDAASDIPSYTMEDIFTAGNEANIPYVIAVGDNDSSEKIIAMIKKIKTITNKPIYIEMGNESWDIDHSVHFPTVEDFANRVKAVYTAVKGFDENIKISVPVYEWEACETAKNDTSGSPQKARFAAWNDGLLAISDYYDAIVVHRYSVPLSWEKKTNTKLMDGFYNMMLSDSKDFSDLEENFAGKEIWITEFGDLPDIFSFCKSYGYYYDNDSKYYNIQSESERTRLQYSKSVGNAVGYATRLMNFLNTPSVTMASYHSFDDPQCFGVIQGDDKLPNWYMFDKMGDVLDKSTHYYKLNPDTDSKLTAYGFGSKNEIKTVVFSNMSNQTASVKIKDYKIKKQWSYGSHNPLPDFGTYEMESYTQLPSELPFPIEYNTSAEDCVNVGAYSITVAEVYCDEIGIDPDLDVNFRNGEISFDGVTTTGILHDGEFYLVGYKNIETTRKYNDAIIEFDFKFINGERLDFKFNLQKDESGIKQYYNQIFFFADKSLYDKGRKISVSEDGKMGDTRIQNDFIFEKNVNYRFKIVKNGKSISLYYRNLDLENSKYIFIETYTHKFINDEQGTIMITAETSGASQMIAPLRLKVYDISNTSQMQIRNVSLSANHLTCDVYPFGATENAHIYAALYEGTRLAEIYSGEVKYNEYKTTVNFTTENADSVKIFTWKQGTQMPMSETFELN